MSNDEYCIMNIEGSNEYNLYQWSMDYFHHSKFNIHHSLFFLLKINCR